MRRLDFTVTSSFDGKSLGTFLRFGAKLSARLTASLKRVENGIMLNGKAARTNELVYGGDVASVNMPDDDIKLGVSNEELDVVFEDDDLLVVNKPAGIAMHPTHNHLSGTLANAVVGMYRKRGVAMTCRSVGRLDKGTSGLVLFALNRYSCARLQGKTDKLYYAVAGGVFIGEGVIDKPIIRPDPNKTLRSVGDDGERAVTRWKEVKRLGNATLLEIRLETGRTHQIRVHFASVGAPLLGDDMYGGDCSVIKRPALHCAELGFIHPVTGEKMYFKTEMPHDMKMITEMKH